MENKILLSYDNYKKKDTEIHKKHRSNTVTLTENREIKKGVQKLPDFVVS